MGLTHPKNTSSAPFVAATSLRPARSAAGRAVSARGGFGVARPVNREPTDPAGRPGAGIPGFQSREDVNMRVP